MSPADFNPQMLTLARRSRDLTQTALARLTQIPQPTIARYEAGSTPAQPDNLTQIADVLDYPIRFFCRKSTLIGMSGGATFHRKQQSLAVGNLYRAHALAEIRRFEVMTMVHSLDVSESAVPEYPVEFFDDDPEKIARSVRAVMNIPPGPIFNLTESLERNGCVVVSHDFNARQIDGFSQNTQYTPCFIHLNADLPPDRWRWTLAHELGHLVMHTDPMAERKLVESQADRFAAEFLAPAHEIASYLNGLTFQKLGGLKREWKISMQALVMRAYHVGAISDRQRRSMFVRLSKAGYRTREPETLDPPIETPQRMRQMAQAHLDQLEYSRAELRDLLAIGEADFSKHYLPAGDDILHSLGIDDLLN